MRSRPHPQRGARCPGLGLPRCPPAALLLAGVEGWAMDGRSWPTSMGELLSSRASDNSSLPQPKPESKEMKWWMQVTAPVCSKAGYGRDLSGDPERVVLWKPEWQALSKCHSQCKCGLILLLNRHAKEVTSLLSLLSSFPENLNKQL